MLSFSLIIDALKFSIKGEKMKQYVSAEGISFQLTTSETPLTGQMSPGYLPYISNFPETQFPTALGAVQHYFLRYMQDKINVVRNSTYI